MEFVCFVVAAKNLKSVSKMKSKSVKRLIDFTTGAGRKNKKNVKYKYKNPEEVT